MLAITAGIRHRLMEGEWTMRWAELLVTVGFGVPAVYCAMMIIVTGYMPADLVFLTVLFNMLFLYGLYEMNRSVVERNGVPVRPKRSLGLTVYAAYLFFLECIQLAFYVMELADRATGPFSAADVLYLSAAAGFTSACAVCAAAMTDWRRWGAIGCSVTGAALFCRALLPVSVADVPREFTLRAGVFPLFAPLSLLKPRLLTRPVSP